MNLLTRGACVVAQMAVVGVCAGAFGATSAIRVVTYNVQADTNGNTTVGPGMSDVLEAIGAQNFNGVTKTIDILGLQETTSNTATVSPIVSSLNSFYGAGTYAMSSLQGTQNGGTQIGNGPNALIYNTTTLQLVASVGVGTPQGSTNGEYRQVMRYEFRPVGGTSANDFYMYVSHMKSSVSDTGQDLIDDQTDRNSEARIIRQNEASLPANASVVYMGDFNMSGSFETAYQTLTSPTVSGISSQGAGVDPLNAANDLTQTWDNNSAFKGELTESAKNLRFRDDLELMTGNVFNDTGALQYIAGSYHTFGNNGTITVGHSVTTATGTGLSSTILSDLTTATDHLPVVADFNVTVPEPASLGVMAAGVVMLLRRRRGA